MTPRCRTEWGETCTRAACGVHVWPTHGPARAPPRPSRAVEAGEVSGIRRWGAPIREIRSARFPLGFPERTDLTVIEAFDDAWLLIEHSPSGAELVGLAEDYDDARAWLAEQPHGRAPTTPDGS